MHRVPGMIHSVKKRLSRNRSRKATHVVSHPVHVLFHLSQKYPGWSHLISRRSGARLSGPETYWRKRNFQAVHR